MPSPFMRSGWTKFGIEKPGEFQRFVLGIHRCIGAVEEKDVGRKSLAQLEERKWGNRCRHSGAREMGARSGTGLRLDVEQLFWADQDWT